MNNLLKNYFSVTIKGGFLPLVLALGITSFSVNAQHYEKVNYGSTQQGYGTSTKRVYQVPDYGRQYQQTMKKQYRKPEAYDTLADTGVYLGAGFAMGSNTGDSMSMKLASTDIVGNSESSNPDAETRSSSADIHIGMIVSSSVRLEMNYSRYTGMNYGNAVSYFDGAGIVQLPVASGGNISSDVFMVNMYYSLQELFGNFAGGKIIPYMGAGIGFAFNKVDSYTISDKTGFPNLNDCWEDVYYNDGLNEKVDGTGKLCSYFYDGMITHIGATNKQMAYRLEFGATWKLQNQMFIDFFFRYNMLGKVMSSGTVIQDYLTDIYYEDGPGVGPYIWDIDPALDLSEQPTLSWKQGQETTTSFNSKEEGNLNIMDFGARFRIMF